MISRDGTNNVKYLGEATTPHAPSIGQICLDDNLPIKTEAL